MGYKWVIFPKSGRFKFFELNTPSCRVFSGLSENRKIISIRQTEHKLWLFEDSASSALWSIHIQSYSCFTVVCVSLLCVSTFSMKTVMKELRKRLLDSDTTVVYYTLLVLDSVMKNCSTDVHSEVLSKEFMNLIKEVIVSAKVPTSEDDTSIRPHHMPHPLQNLK